MSSIEFEIDRSLYPFESRWFQGQRGRMHYVDEGEGPPIVFFHGNPTWSFLYRNVITLLRDRFRCIAIDYLGFGLSERPDDYGYTAVEHATAVGELLDYLDLRDFITMGQDWGGPISMAVACARHDRVRGVVLGNTWFWPADEWRFKLFGALAPSWPVQALLRNSDVMVDIIKYMTRERPTTAVMRHYLGVQPDAVSRRGVAEFVKQIGAAHPLLAELDHDVPRLLGSKPALIVWGMRDPAFRPAHSLSRLTDTFSDSVVVRLPDARHFIQEDAPDAIGEAIAQRFG